MKKGKTILSKIKGLTSFLVDPIVSIILALLVGGIFIAFSKVDVGQAYQALLEGAIGNKKAIAQTLISATPLMFTAFAFSIAFRSGVFNLGGEGQFYAGAILGAWAGFAIQGLPGWLHMIVVMLCGALGGALFGFIPAYLKAKRGVNEVITSIMLNYIAIDVTNYLVSSTGPLLKDSTLPATPKIAESCEFSYIMPGTRLTIGYFIAVACSIFIFIFLWKTRTGYKARAVGLNVNAAEYAGIKTMNYAILTMVMAGAFAGLGGAIEILAVHHRFYGNFSSGYGFEGVAVGMLGGNHPFGIIFSSILYGALKSGATAMQIKAGTNAEIVKVLQALVIFFIACKWSVVSILKRVITKRKDKSTSTAKGKH